MNLRLIRDYKGADCTMGTLSLWTPAEDLLLQTMERPWIPSDKSSGGKKGESCVPEGVYKLVRHESKKHGQTWALVNHALDVVHYEGDDKDPDEDRATTLLHSANYARQLEGCIAPGLDRAIDDAGERMVTSSKLAMLKIKRILPWTDDHTLEIL